MIVKMDGVVHKSLVTFVMRNGCMRPKITVIIFKMLRNRQHDKSQVILQTDIPRLSP